MRCAIHTPFFGVYTSVPVIDCSGRERLNTVSASAIGPPRGNGSWPNTSVVAGAGLPSSRNWRVAAATSKCFRVRPRYSLGVTPVGRWMLVSGFGP